MLEEGCGEAEGSSAGAQDNTALPVSWEYLWGHVRIFWQKNEVHLGILNACISLPALNPVLLEAFERERFKIAWKLKQDCLVIDSNSARSDSELSPLLLPPALMAKKGFWGFGL